MPAPTPFDFVPTHNPDKLSFWVLVNTHDVTVENLPEAGVTTLKEFKLPTAGRPHSSYDACIYTHHTAAQQVGFLQFYFSRLPGTPIVTERTDPIMGVVYDHVYLDVIGSTLAVKGATTLLGEALDSGRYVHSALESQVSGQLGQITVTTVLPPGPKRCTKITDGDYGTIYKSEQFVLSTTSLPAIGDNYVANSAGTITVKVASAQLVDDDGVFATLQVIGSVSQTGTQKKDQDIDQIFCAAKILNQRVPSTTTIPERGDTYTLDGDATTYYVIDASLKDDDGVNATLQVRLSLVNTKTFVEYVWDSTTGVTYPKTEVYYIGDAEPVGASTNLSGAYSETKRLGCNYWVTLYNRATTLPIGEANATTWYGTEQESWPEVTKSIVDTQIGTADDPDIVADYVLAHATKARYTGPCRAKYERWWQKNAPPMPNPTEMVAVGMYAAGVYRTIDLQPTLHPYVRYWEQQLSTADPKYQRFELLWEWAATNLTDWPSAIVHIEAKMAGGGFECMRTTIYSPAEGSIGGDLTFTSNLY